MLSDNSTHNIDRRSESTKGSIIVAALDLFGQYGYDATSTRMISDKSNSNISAIGYYFGGKEGLYLAVMTNIMQESSQYLADIFEYKDKFLVKSKMTKAESLKLLDIITNSLARMFVEAEESRSWAKVIIREQSNPSQAFDILYNNNIEPLQQIYAKIAAVNLGLRHTNLEAKIVAHTLFSQILGFCVCRESFLRLLGVNKLSDSHIKMIKKILMKNSRAILRK